MSTGPCCEAASSAKRVNTRGGGGYLRIDSRGLRGFKTVVHNRG